MLDKSGETLTRKVVRFPNRDDVTDSRKRYLVALVDADSLAPRETKIVRVAVNDVQAAIKKLKDDLDKGKVKIRLILDQVYKSDARNVSAKYEFSFRREDEKILDAALKAAGDILQSNVSHVPPGANVTDAKVLARIVLVSAEMITPRETFTLRIATADVAKKYDELKKVIDKVQSRIIKLELDKERLDLRGELNFEVPKESAGDVQALLGNAGETIFRNRIRMPDGEDVTDAKVRFLVELLDYNSTLVAPRETIHLKIAAGDVPATYGKLRKLLDTVKVRIFKDEDPSNIKAQLDFTFMRSDEAKVKEGLAAAGEVLVKNVVRAQEKTDVTDAKVFILVELVDINSSSVTPRETVALKIAAGDVSASFTKLRDLLGSIKARIITDQLNDKDNDRAQLDFTYSRSDEQTVKQALAAAGEQLSRSVVRAAQRADVTDAKIYVQLELIQADTVPARDVLTLKVAALNVRETFDKLSALAARVKGRVTRNELKDVAGQIDFDVPRKDESQVLEILANTETLKRDFFRQPDGSKVTDAKVGFRIELVAAATNIVPRETTTLVLEVADVSAALTKLEAMVKQADGRSDRPKWASNNNRSEVTAVATFDVPLKEGPALLEKLKALGVERLFEPTSDPQAPEGKLALARFTVTLTNTPFLSRDDGLFSQVRQAMSVSLKVLFKSFGWLVAGLSLLGPWLVVAGGVYLVSRRMWRSDEGPVLTAAPMPAEKPQAPEGHDVLNPPPSA